MLDAGEPTTGINWETMGETLENAGISWKVYQGKDNFDDNGFAWFENFRNAAPGSPLYDKGMAREDDFVAAFAADVAKDTLPQVSWLVGPTSLSEHAEKAFDEVELGAAKPQGGKPSKDCNFKGESDELRRERNALKSAFILACMAPTSAGSGF